MKRHTFTALALLLCAASASAQQPAGQSAPRKLSLPGKSWALEIDLGRLKLGQDQSSPDGRARRIDAAVADEGYMLTLMMAPASQPGDAGALRDLAAENMKGQMSVKRDDFKTSDYKQMPTLEYLIKEFRSVPLNQKHLNAYLSRDGVWIDIHFSKTRFKPGDEKLFYAVLDTVRFVEGTADNSGAAAAPATDERMEHLRRASSYYQRGDYKGAIPHYRKALELEKQGRRLDKNLWRVLVDNLGMAYGITGDLASAKETFEYGLSEDATYPMFHYNMACTYAEMNDLDNALVYLKRAFEHRGNMISGEEMPDPAEDSSFKRFRKDERFRAFLKEIKR